MTEQPQAPYLDALVAYGFRGSTRFHVPGHKGGRGADPGLLNAIGLMALQLDVPQDIEGIDLGPSPTPYERAERLAADAHGAARTFFLTNGASQGNHALCLALAPVGAQIVVQRNSHSSVIDGLVLSGGVPSFVAPAYDEGLGMAHGVEPGDLDAALEAAPEATVAFVVSPTYYGLAADVKALATIAHDRGVALVVDQSWGPHFGFHPELPPSALALGADAVLTSTHKIVGSLTQSAMLHVAPTGRVDPDAVARAVRLVRSTSQSSLLLASLDAARRQLAVHGEALLTRTLRALIPLREAIDAVQGCAVIGEDLVGRPGVAAWDPLRVVVDVRGTGRTGYDVAAALRGSYDVQVELATHATVVLVVGIAQPTEDLERFAYDFAETVSHIERPGEAEALIRGSHALHNEVAMSPRDAFLGRAESVPVEEAVGCVSAETVAGYPPGIPALLPGERLTREAIDYLRELVAAGAQLHGASDPSFNSIYVVRDAIDELLDLVDRALEEDVGTGDVTTEATVPADQRAIATIVHKQPGVVSGLDVAEAVFRRLDPDCAVERGQEGVWHEVGTVALRVEGRARALLTGERTALNVLQRLSGVATVTAQVVNAVQQAGGGATILDTRKTTPGLRGLEKAAVVAGGGTNHRTGLFDAILIKENHAAMAGGVGAAVDAARAARPDLAVEVEVRDTAELDEALAAGADRVLLDNMTPEEVAAAVARVGGRAQTEASGGITPETVVVYATINGLDFVSLGWLTHSAPALDLSLRLETLPS